MRSKLLFVGRNKELDWLGRTSRLSPVLVIVGVRGIGKTWLVRHWTESSKWNCRWISADRLKSLAELLGQEGDAESALDQMITSWKGLDAVIWDDVEQIHPKARHTLLSFLKATPGLPLQIVVSDEELSREFSMDFPQLKLGPFNPGEIREFLTLVQGAANGDSVEESIEELEKKTGGVPLLLRLWLQSPEEPATLVHSLLEGLSELECRMFSFGSVLGRNLSVRELAGLLDESQIEPLAENLLRKNLFERVPGQSDVYRAPSFIRNLYLKEASEGERLGLKRDLLAKLFEKKSADSFELFLLAVDIKDGAALNEVILGVDLESLETLSAADLREVLSGVEAMASSAFDSLEKHARFVRIHTRALFLVGRRADALKVAEAFAKKIHGSRELSAEEQYFVHGYVQLLNRNSQFSKGQQTAKAFIPQFNDPIHSLLAVELAVSVISSNLPEARSVLEKTLQKAEQVIAGGASNRDWLFVRTQAHFQLGRVLDLSDELKSSEQHFAVAKEGYKRDLDQTYGSAISAMNCAWLLFRLRDWDRLGEALAGAKLEAEKFGYHYVLAGLSIVDSGRSRYFLQPGAGLQKIEAAIRYLGPTPPLQPLVDGGAEKVRVLMQLGLRDRALQEFKKIEATVKESPDSIVLEQQESLRLEMDASQAPLSEWIEKWEPSKYGRESWKRLIARTGMREVSEADRAELAKFPLGKIALIESDLVRALQRGERDQVWHHISEMEQAFIGVADPAPERIATILLQINLLDDVERRAELSQQAEIELLRWGCDPELKAPFQAWFNALKDEKKSGSPEKDSFWKKAPAGDRDRWRKWWDPLWKKEAKKYKVHGLQKVTETDKAPTAKDLGKGLFVSEELAEAICNGKRIKELGSRHSLRKLLALVLECFPQSVSKATLAGAVWGESYNPQIHDSRVYTSVQRLRSLIKLKDCIQSLDNGYRWNPKVPFTLVKPTQQEAFSGEGNPRVQALLLHALESYAQGGRPWVSRSELVEVAGSSDATVKRELSRLVSEGLIQRRGAGRAVEYSKVSRF